MPQIIFGTPVDYTPRIRRFPNDDRFADGKASKAQTPLPPARMVGSAFSIAESPGDGWAFSHASNMCKFPFTIQPDPNDNRQEYDFYYFFILIARYNLSLTMGSGRTTAGTTIYKSASSKTKVSGAAKIINALDGSPIINWVNIGPLSDSINHNMLADTTINPNDG